MGMFQEWMDNGADERICSVTTGLVKNNWDQEHPGMIKAEYFLGTQGKNVTGWIPVVVPYAAKDCGMYALPEIGSEVVIAFNMGNRNCPIVIGCLWNQKNTIPKETADDKNTIKRFKTKGGSEIIFDEKKGKEKITIHTPSEMHITIDDEEEKILLEDKKKKNSIGICIKEGVVSIAADKKIELKADGKQMLLLDGKSGTITAKTDAIKLDTTKSMKMKSQSVKIEGAQMEIKGNSKIALQSSGVAELKGSMVKIN